MERLAAETTPSEAFVGWEERFVTSDRGRKEFRYYLKRRDGTSDLAVVGKEKSLRHMSYRYAIRDRSLLSITPSSSLLKLRSRKEVIDWLNSIVPVSDIHGCQSSQPVGSLEGRNASELELETLKDVQLRKMCNYTTEFSWIGSPWTCRKRRRHYKSFQRNGVEISLYDFVYVLAEEDKRLVAYLDDMYEDSKGNKMVVVRWFHKIDEVGIVLPQNYNDREIFFSLCLQDLSIECIDGLAIVLSPLHYEKFLNEATHTQLEPFLCQRQFDNDDVKPFDITQIKGYWKQGIIRSMFPTYPSKVHLKSQHSNDGLVEGNCGDAIGTRPRKRLRQSKDCDMYLQSANKQEALGACLDMQCYSSSLIGSKGGIDLCRLEEGCSAASLSGKDAIVQKHLQHLTIGSQVEVLSQDSGIRGCWFRALIIKKHKDKVKVQYQDIKDAADEANNLQEWILASRVAISDELGLRICGRTTVRPTPPSSKSSVSWFVNVGSVVDVWWHDGWWEGIIVQKESEDRIHVYFPGEKRESIFGRSDLRPSQEWLGTGWKHIKERPELVTSMLSDLEKKLGSVKSCNGKPDQAAIRDDKELVGIIHKDGLSVKCEVGCSNSRVGPGAEKVKDLEVVQDLSKDDLLTRFKWSSRKKRRGRNSSQKLHNSVGKSRSPDVLGSQTSGRFFIPSSLKVDQDNCKFIRDSLFTSSVVSPLTSLVMSR